MRALCVVATLLLAPTSVAHAQGNASAEASFAKGRKLMKEGNHAEACAAFEQSFRIDPQMGTQYNLALCWEKLGKVASAWAAFREVAQRDQRAERKAEARAHAEALEPRLTRLVVVATQPVPALVVLSNEQDITRHLGIETPVDPGEYTLTARAPGFKQWSTTVVVRAEGQTISISISPLEADPEARKAAALRPHVAQPLPAGPAPSKTRKRAGQIAVAGGGALAFGGLAVGYLAWRKWNEAKDLCGEDLKCDSTPDHRDGQALVSAARFRGNVSTGLVGAGALALGIGAALWLTAPEQREHRAFSISPTVTSTSVGFVIGGAL